MLNRRCLEGKNGKFRPIKPVDRIVEALVSKHIDVCIKGIPEGYQRRYTIYS
jgi:hypothetical protein